MTRTHIAQGPSRLGRKTLALVVGAAVALTMTACSSADRNASSDAFMVGEGSTEDRQANALVNQLYVCIQNKTAEPISLVWSEYMKNTSGNQLDSEQLSKTLGPDAFDCAVSFSYHWNEHAQFKIEGTTLVASNSGETWLIGNSTNEYDNLRRGQVTTWPFTGSTDEQRRYEMRGVGTYTLRTIDKVKAYPVDIQIVEAP